jgi:hypothetical protein
MQQKDIYIAFILHKDAQVNMHTLLYKGLPKSEGTISKQEVRGWQLLSRSHHCGISREQGGRAEPTYLGMKIYFCPALTPMVAEYSKAYDRTRSFVPENIPLLHRGCIGVYTLFKACLVTPYLTWWFCGLQTCHWFTERLEMLST